MTRRFGGRSVVAVLLGLSLVTASATAGAQSQDWPDGNYVGYFSGAGSAAGVDPETGTPFTGSAGVSGTFELAINDGLVAGDYRLTWTGSGQSDLGSGTSTITELGLISGDLGLPILERETASGATTVDGFTVQIPSRALPPSPAPLIAEHNECLLIEGIFASKLAGLEDAFATFGITANSEEAFTALRIDTGDAALKDELLTTMDRLGEIIVAINDLAIKGWDNPLAAIWEVTLLLDEAERLMANLEGLALCTDFDPDQFSLGMSTAVANFINNMYNAAIEIGQYRAPMLLASLAARAGVLTEIAPVGIAITDKMFIEARDADNLQALEFLLAAAVGLGDEALAGLIYQAILVVRGS